MTTYYLIDGKRVPVPQSLTPQATTLLLRLYKTESITQREALIDHGIQSLTRRILELRDAGFNIKTERKKHPVTGQRYARYVLVGGAA